MDNYKNTKNFKTLNFYTLKKSHPYQSISLIYFGDDKIQKSRPDPNFGYMLYSPNYSNSCPELIYSCKGVNLVISQWSLVISLKLGFRILRLGFRN